MHIVHSGLDPVAAARMPAAAANSANHSVVLDLKHLRTYTLGDPQLEREILHLYFGEIPRLRNALTQASSQKDWHMAAHTLKGSSLSVGAWEVAQAASALERLTISDGAGRTAGLGHLDAALAALTLELERLGLV